MGELLDFIFICILVYYILKMLFRWLAPVMFEKVVNKAQEQQQQRQQQFYSNNQQQQFYNNNSQQQYYSRTKAGNGKIKVDYVPPKKEKKKGSIPDSEGDFVDYEEVK